MNVILFVLYGENREYHLELTYSVLSAWRFLRSGDNNTRIVLFADRPNLRPDLPVECVEISKDTLTQWRLGGRYSHAIQVYALHHALERFRDKVILVDTDTYFKAHPKLLFDRISSGRAVMHKDEGPLGSSPDRLVFEELVAKCTGDLGGYPVSMTTRMFNGGVVGLSPSDKEHLADVKRCMEEVLDTHPVFTAVQLAASVVLQSTLQLSFADDVIRHYWGASRPYVHYQIERMFPDFEKASQQAMEGHFQIVRDVPPRRVSHRIAARLKRWRRSANGAYEYAYLAYRSALEEEGQPAYSNMWAKIALNLLQFGAFGSKDDVREDFREFGAGELDRHLWMTDKVRKQWQEYWKALD